MPAHEEHSMKFTLNDLIGSPRPIKPDRRQFIGGSDARIIMSPDEAALNPALEGKARRGRTGGPVGGFMA